MILELMELPASSRARAWASADKKMSWLEIWYFTRREHFVIFQKNTLLLAKLSQRLSEEIKSGSDYKLDIDCQTNLIGA